jgi:hypothetical protein
MEQACLNTMDSATLPLCSYVTAIYITCVCVGVYKVSNTLLIKQGGTQEFTSWSSLDKLLVTRRTH